MPWSSITVYSVPGKLGTEASKKTPTPAAVAPKPPLGPSACALNPASQGDHLARSPEPREHDNRSARAASGPVGHRKNVLAAVVPRQPDRKRLVSAENSR